MTSDNWLREQQHELIAEIRDTPLKSSTAIEAPTGTGKSRAALVVAAEEGRAVIATSTKALSHQYKNEVDGVFATVGGTYKVLSGKRAMDCYCPPRRKHSRDCPWPDHLEEARRADVVVTNFALLATVAKGLIPTGIGRRSTVIIDEAHEFCAPRELEPDEDEQVERASRGAGGTGEEVYWQPDEVAEAILSGVSGSFGAARFICMSATMNASSPVAPVKDPFVLTSAGIRVDRSVVLETPFDWAKQLSLSSVRVPDANWAEFAVDAVQGGDGRGTLIITRSHREKNWVADALVAWGIDVLTQAELGQGRSSQANDVRDALRERPGLVVVGTDTLMTGLDVRGDALGNIIVCGPPGLYGDLMTPYEITTRMGRLRPDLADPTANQVRDNYLIPNRSLRLAQAIGRGVRSTTDTAKVVVGCANQLDDSIYAAAMARFQM